MKRISLIFILICAAMISAAQEVQGKWDQPTRLYGLYNERYGKWVVRPKYSDVDYLGAYNGTHYWKVKSKESSLWGAMEGKVIFVEQR